MELSNAKVLIASDGEKTFVLVNGTPLIGDGANDKPLGDSWAIPSPSGAGMGRVEQNFYFLRFCCTKVCNKHRV